MLIKVEGDFQHVKLVKNQRGTNYLKALRKKTGLSQRELARLIGYKDAGQISRHERSSGNPPLATALAYEMIFRVPLSLIFTGIQASLGQEIETRLRELKAQLEALESRPANPSLVAQKLSWLDQRERQRPIRS